MRAYAQRMGQPRLFCLIDGYDMIRLLRAYKKCGFADGDTHNRPLRLCGSVVAFAVYRELLHDPLSLTVGCLR